MRQTPHDVLPYSFNTKLRLKLDKELRECFVSGEAEDEDGLAPVKDDNEGWRKAGRKDCRILIAG